MAEESFQKIITRLIHLDRAQKRAVTIWALLTMVCLALGVFLVCLVLSLGFDLGTNVRLSLWVLLIIGLAYVSGYRWLPFVLRQANLGRLASQVEVTFPSLKNRLVAALDCQRFLKQNEPNYSPDLMKAVIIAAEKETATLKFEAVVDRQPLRKMSRLVIALGLITLIFPILAPGTFSEALLAFIQPRTQIQTSLSYRVTVAPGNAEVVKFTEVKVQALATGTDLPRKMIFHWQNEGGNWQEETVYSEKSSAIAQSEKHSFIRGAITATVSRSQDSALYQFVFREVKKNLAYFFSAPNYQSAHYKITVVDIPRVTRVMLTLDYPAYSRLGTVVKDENDGTISALTGTKVRLEVTANKEVKAATLIFADSTRQQMAVHKRAIQGQIVIKKNTSYHVQLVDRLGNQNRDPIEYQVTALPDQAPSVEVIKPGADIDLNEEMQVKLAIQAQDDYGFSQLLMKYKIIPHSADGDAATSERKRELPISIKNGTNLTYDEIWSVDRLPLLPGDVVQYWVEVADNNTISGPQWGKSKTYYLRLPTLDEIISETFRQTDDNVTGLQKVLRGEKDLQQRLDELAKKINRQQEVNWETKQELEKVAEQHNQFLQNVQKVADLQHETAEKLSRNRLAQKELIEKLQEMQRLIDEVAPPELKEALKKLQSALNQLDPELVKKALENMKQDQQAMIARLERTIDLLKRLALEQKMDALLKMVEKLMEGQKQVNATLKETPEEKIADLASEEKKLEQQLDELTRKADHLQQELKKDEEFNLPQSEQFCQSAGSSKAKKPMQQMQQQLSAKQKEPATKSGEQARQELEAMFQIMAQAQSAVSQCRKRGILGEMKKALEDALWLSESQEQLITLSTAPDFNNRSLRELAQDQNNLKVATEKLADRLEGTAKKSFFVPQPKNSPVYQAVAKMGSALKSLEASNRTSAQTDQQDALFLLNQVAKDLLTGIQNAAKSASGSGGEELLQRMQNLANQQLSLNQQSELLLPQIQPQPTPQQLQQLARMRAEQESIQRRLQELSSEFSSRKEILGNIDRLAEEIERVLKDYETQKYGPQTLERQKNILSRMLDYSKSLQQRDYTEQRRAEFGQDIIRRSPQFPQGWNRFSDNDRTTGLLNFEDEVYPPEYEMLIRSYLKALGEATLK